jgi:hypothetical protein
LTGDYFWHRNRGLKADKFRPLRTFSATRRHAEPRRRAQFPRASDAAEFCGLVGGLAALCRTLYRVVWCRTLQFREQFSPVDKMGIGYATLWNTFKRITAGCSHTEKLALYSGTAKRLYHLD